MRIRDAYRFIAERWEDGDNIYAFAVEPWQAPTAD